LASGTAIAALRSSVVIPSRYEEADNEYDSEGRIENQAEKGNDGDDTHDGGCLFQRMNGGVLD
jgi:hypothetical protein